MSRPHIELDIKDLILEGFASADQYRIADALQGELVRLFTLHGVPRSFAQGAQVSRLNGEAFQVSTGSRPEAIGIQVARSVYGGLRL